MGQFAIAKVAACITCSERNDSSQRPIRRCTERHSEVLGIRSADPRFAGGNTGANGSLYLDGDLLEKYIKHAHVRTEQEVYIWMTTSDMGFPVTQEREEGQYWRDIVEDRSVLVPVITDYISGLQDKGTGGEGAHMLLPDLEVLDREWSQDDRQSTGNCPGRKHCLTGCRSLQTSLILTCLNINIARVRNHTRGTGNKRLSQDGRTVRIHSQTRM